MARKFDFCVLGGSPAGRHVATRLARAGYKTALIGEYSAETEKPLLEALQKAAATYQAIEQARIYGLQATPAPVHYPLVRDFLLKQMEAPAGAGRPLYTYIQGEARFTSPSKVAVDTETVTARSFVLDPPLRIRRPALEGLSQIPVLTPDNLFGLPDLPPHLLLIGGGPTGAAFAQAFARLGSKVSLLTRGAFLKHFDEEYRSTLRQQLYREGVSVIEEATPDRVVMQEQELLLTYTSNRAEYHLRGTHLMLTTGRAPDWSLLNLPAAKLDPAQFAPHSLLTPRPHIFSLADVAAHQNPHLAVEGLLAHTGHRTKEVPLTSLPRHVLTHPALVQIGTAGAGMERYEDGQGRKLWVDAADKVKAVVSLGAEIDVAAAYIAIAEGWTLTKLATMPGPFGRLAATYAKPAPRRGLFG